MGIILATWQAPKNSIEKGRMGGDIGMCSVPREGKMPYVLAQVRTRPVPGTSRAWGMGEVLVYVRRKAAIMISL